MRLNKREIEELALYLDDFARNEKDNQAASTLRELLRVYEVSSEVVHAKTHEYRNSAYAELIDLIKGKKGD